MSEALYTRLLRWGPRGGVAKLHGRAVVLQAPPDLGMAIFEVDYVPAVHIGLVRERACDPRRDMTQAELQAAEDFLHRLLPP